MGVQDFPVRDGKAIFISCNVTSADDCQRAVETTLQAFGGLDILFNNAGIVYRANVLTTPEAEWDRVMEVNLKSKPIRIVRGDATISDDSESIYTPCVYGLEKTRIEDVTGSCYVTELLSYRGKFT
jgi:NAD(P)-dependent dehydrogenase (short-subunit alcohol dehydrogenase family)